MKILISDIVDNAMTPFAGDCLRKKMDEIFKTDIDAKITLDFSGIELFATPFFNRSTGYFFLQFENEEIYNSKIRVINLDALGKETYEYSLETARQLLKNKLSDKVTSILKTIKNDN